MIKMIKILVPEDILSKPGKIQYYMYYRSSDSVSEIDGVMNVLGMI